MGFQVLFLKGLDLGSILCPILRYYHQHSVADVLPAKVGTVLALVLCSLAVGQITSQWSSEWACQGGGKEASGAGEVERWSRGDEWSSVLLNPEPLYRALPVLHGGP